MSKNVDQPKSNLFVIFIIVVIFTVASFIVGRFTAPQNGSLVDTQTTTATTTLMSNVTTADTIKTATSSSTSNNTIVETLYDKKTIQLPAPKYNPTFNYVTGCYWTDGYYNFSFNAPYSGYIVFNESNSGIPNNFTWGYWNLITSTEKPRYVNPSPYNGSYWCPGETVQSNVAPYTILSPYNNETMIIPVVSGINYMFFQNGNANQEHGVNPFSINLTFSMKYYGFKNVSYPVQPPFDFNKTVDIAWGKYQ